MTIQYTAQLGASERDVVKTAVGADPGSLDVVVYIATNVHTAKGYMVSTISETIEDLGNRFLNATQYGILNNGVISGLARKPEDANGLATVVADILGVGLDEITIFTGNGITQVDDQLVNQTILTIKDFYLSDEGVQ